MKCSKYDFPNLYITNLFEAHIRLYYSYSLTFITKYIIKSRIHSIQPERYANFNRLSLFMLKFILRVRYLFYRWIGNTISGWRVPFLINKFIAVRFIADSISLGNNIPLISLYPYSIKNVYCFFVSTQINFRRYNDIGEADVTLIRVITKNSFLGI